MVVYNVFSSSVSYQYKTYLCSKATIVLILTSVLTLFFPVLFTYRSHGFWLRTDVYQEQPDVSYKYDYILLMDTTRQENTIICSNIHSLQHLTQKYNHCPFIKAKEEDINRDGIKDLLNFTIHIAEPKEEIVRSVTLLLIFDYKLTSYCRAQMEVMGVIQHNHVEDKAGLSTVADLSLVQRQPLRPRQLDTRYNTSVVPQSPSFSLNDVFIQYALRNISARLTNVYSMWSTGRVARELLTIQATILYAEASVRYRPTLWQLLQGGWVQLFPVLFISILVFRAVKDFIFTNQLIYTYKDIPWKKSL